MTTIAVAVVSIITPFAWTLLATGELPAWIAAAVTIAAIISVSIAVLLFYSSQYYDQHGYDHLYIELGYFWKWDWFWSQFEPLTQVGYYTNMVETNYPFNYLFQYTYIPIISLPVETYGWHTSVFPNNFPVES